MPADQIGSRRNPIHCPIVGVHAAEVRPADADGDDRDPVIPESSTEAASQTAGVVRQTVELLVLLCLSVLLVRTFSAEAYVVPTGSMAPTLLGLHRELTCPNCHFVFVVGTR